MQCFTTVSTANALATSPCASPPIPSDNTNRCSGATMRKQSSLLVRTRPTSVTPPLTICTQTPLPPRDTPAQTQRHQPRSHANRRATYPCTLEPSYLLAFFPH